MIGIGNLIVECTRWCNIECGHCLRGPRQKLSMKRPHLVGLLHNVNYIGSLTLTGGEPSLAPNVIEDIVYFCMSREIRIGTWYIATNGVKVSKRFIDVVERLSSYCEESSASAVELSNDYYHESETGGRTQDHKLYDAVDEGKFQFRKKYNAFQKDIQSSKLLNEGRALGAGTESPEAPKLIYDRSSNYDIYLAEGEIYLNCKGNVISGCNWSYRSQDKPENIICRASEFNEDLITRVAALGEDWTEDDGDVALG